MSAAAFLLGAALGAIAALAGNVLWGRHLVRRGEDPIVHGRLLGKEVYVLKGDGRWRRCTVVAVSHKGAMAVRNVGDGSGRHAKWIPKDEVPSHVRRTAPRDRGCRKTEEGKGM